MSHGWTQERELKELGKLDSENEKNEQERTERELKELTELKSEAEARVAVVLVERKPLRHGIGVPLR